MAKIILQTLSAPACNTHCAELLLPVDLIPTSTIPPFLHAPLQHEQTDTLHGRGSNHKTQPSHHTHLSSLAGGATTHVNPALAHHSSLESLFFLPSPPSHHPPPPAHMARHIPLRRPLLSVFLYSILPFSRCLAPSSAVEGDACVSASSLAIPSL